jgi:hypothetical protein
MNIIRNKRYQAMWAANNVADDVGANDRFQRPLEARASMPPSAKECLLMKRARSLS